MVDAINDSKDAVGGDLVRPSQRVSRWVNGVSFIVLVACLILLARVLPVDRAVQAIQGGVDQLGVFGSVVFAAAYILAGLLFVPGSALTLASGALFGLVWGTAIVSIASTITAALAFLIARYAARERVRRAAGRNRRFAAIDQAIGKGGWRIVALLRLSPAVPFSLGNYLYGLTSIRFWPYLFASWLCMLPGTFMYVYIGHLGVEGLQAAGGGSNAVGVGKTVLLVAGLAATVVVTVYITRLARRALAEQGALAAAAGPASPEASSAAARNSASRARVAALPLAALLMATLTTAAWWKQDAIRGLFGPPTATLQEAYSEKSDDGTFDHSHFDSLLRKHVSKGGWVDYEGLKADSAILDAYIASLEKAPFDSLGRDEKLALLINAYNASTLRLILDHYPVKSVKDIPDAKRWADKRWKVAGGTWSLNQIEHEQIRPKFREPRVHFALVCAAIGCPPLRAEAYTGARLGTQLADQTQYVHTHDRWFRFDSKSDVVKLTKLYDWYGDDFKQVAGTLLAYVGTHSKDLQAALDAKKPPRIEWLDYDWRINSRENRP
ncbi:MAG: VTT domain-containing protein [Phycisphaerales bacterium]|nr:VTT domain-containing protein [Phycisphaerales bacterium]